MNSTPWSSPRNRTIWTPQISSPGAPNLDREMVSKSLPDLVDCAQTRYRAGLRLDVLPRPQAAAMSRARRTRPVLTLARGAESLRMSRLTRVKSGSVAGMMDSHRNQFP